MRGELLLWMSVSILVIMAIWHIITEFINYINGKRRLSFVFLKGSFIVCAIILLIMSYGKRMSEESINVGGSGTVETVTQRRTDEVAKKRVEEEKGKIKVDKEKQREDEEEAIESMDEFRKRIMNRRKIEGEQQ